MGSTTERFFVDRAEPADLGAVMELERASFAAGIVEDAAIFRARMETFPAGFLLLRDAETGAAAGYLCAERWAADPGDDADGFALGHDPAERYASDGPILYTASMAVSPAYRGAGLGAQLFSRGRERILSAAPGIDIELLIVNEDWTGARRIYERAGFAARAALRAFFAASDGTRRAAIVMERAGWIDGAGSVR
jgi:ribosomal-protein-alanine N-acetyltransferase